MAIIKGANGNDYLVGTPTNDIIYGYNGDDTLDGGSGADALYGGYGSDTYYVDNVGDVLIEDSDSALGGVDRVFSTVNFTLGFGLENLTLTGAGNINGLVNGTGNDNNNVITGNSVDNILSGGLGNDTLIGGLGHDTLIGGLSNDTLIGGLGADTFVFNNRSEGVDIIKDFQWTEGDTIQLSKIGFGATSLSQFNYNNLNGNLSFQGNTFAIIENKPSDFVVSLGGTLVVLV